MTPKLSFPCSRAGLLVTALAVILIASGSLQALADDVTGPVTYNLAVGPTKVRIGIDSTVTIVATASDVNQGGSNIAAAEYYVGASTGAVPDPGVGNGIPMDAGDGAFDSPAEMITAQVSAVGWTSDRRIFMRSKDAAGNWGSVNSIVVGVSNDTTPPGTVTDFKASPAGSLGDLAFTVSACSSAGSLTPVSALLDSPSLGTYWMTAGTTTPQTEYVTFDLTTIQSVGAVYMSIGKNWKLFPTEVRIETSLDGSSWDPATRWSVTRITSSSYLWEFESTQVRYVKVSGPGMYNAADHRYYWQIGTAALYMKYGMLLNLSWTAPSSNGYAGGGNTDSVSRYDVRYRSLDSTGITADNWDGCTSITGVSSPSMPGHYESMIVNVDSTDAALNVRMESVDDSNNWSGLSNQVQIKPNVTAFEPMSPDDASSITATDVPAFTFKVDPSLTAMSICFSGSDEFPGKPAANASGQIDRTARYPLKLGTATWTPTATQWRVIKGLVGTTGVLNWRLEGLLGLYVAVTGTPRTLEFDAGSIIGLGIDGSHFVNTDEAVWPDSAAPLEFTWLDATTAMKYFLVDVSTDQNVPLSDKKKTITFGGTGVIGESYTLTKAQWLSLRKLANASAGVLYWRVRAKDADKALASVSDISKLIVDGGTWTLTGPTTNAGTTSYSWTPTAEGIVKYNLQFSADPLFPASVKDTLTVPVTPITGTSYTLKAAEATRLQKFSTAKGAPLYWRVRGTDTDRAFTTYSQPHS